MGDKIRTLSDAMLLGSTFRKQSWTDIYHNGRTCALGAAAEAIGINVTEGDNLDTQELLEARFPATEMDEEIPCPVTNCVDSNYSVYDSVVHLNDEHHWKRERIAEWLKTKGL